MSESMAELEKIGVLRDDHIPYIFGILPYRRVIHLIQSNVKYVKRLRINVAQDVLQTRRQVLVE